MPTKDNEKSKEEGKPKKVAIIACIREDKIGYIDNHQSPILKRLGLDSEQWLTLTTEFEQHFATAVGSEQMMQQFKHHTHHQRIRGMAKARALLKSA